MQHTGVGKLRLMDQGGGVLVLCKLQWQGAFGARLCIQETDQIKPEASKPETLCDNPASPEPDSRKTSDCTMLAPGL